MCCFNNVIKRLSNTKIMAKWLIEPIQWTGDHRSILFSQDTIAEPIPNLTLDQIIQKSSSFPIQFPIDTSRCYQLKGKTSKQTLESNINSAYPVLHEYGLYLCSLFLLYQRDHGLQQEFYKEMSLTQLIDRLLKKRAVMFFEAEDNYQLLSGERGTGNWESIGTKDEKEPLVLNKCLSYDEIKLSALLSVSSYSYLINDGYRYNVGNFEKDRNKVEENGVVVGLIDTRLEKPKVMEYNEIIKSKEQNNGEYGYGVGCVSLQNEFLNFYGDTCGTYEELKEQMEASQDRYIDLAKDKFFDKLMYGKRMAMSIDMLLLEANDRAKRESKMAYIRVSGLGLGIWKFCLQQNQITADTPFAGISMGVWTLCQQPHQIFMDTFAERLELLSEVLTNVSDVCFASMEVDTAGKYEHGDKINHIKIDMVDIYPHVKLKGEDEGKLLVVSYTWDGNALPGNEFWGGSLSGSDDAANACSTQVAELHNGHINEKVCGKCLRVATSKGLMTFQEYQDLHKDD